MNSSIHQLWFASHHRHFRCLTKGCSSPIMQCEKCVIPHCRKICAQSSMFVYSHVLSAMHHLSCKFFMLIKQTVHSLPVFQCLRPGGSRDQSRYSLFPGIFRAGNKALAQCTSNVMSDAQILSSLAKSLFEACLDLKSCTPSLDTINCKIALIFN